MSISFTDNSMKVKKEIADAVESFLYEAGGEVVAKTVDNSRTDTGQTKGSYKYKVSAGESEATVYVGSNLENAIWEEYGTGEYALNGNGRKTPWVYQDKKTGAFYVTKGKKPNRPLTRAFDSVRSKFEKMLESKLKRV